MFVGGIGIFASMLMSVKERTNEIGLRKAIGASRKDILIQFLLESAIMGITGGILGIIIGLIITLSITLFTSWLVCISVYIITFSFTFSFIVLPYCFFTIIVKLNNANKYETAEKINNEMIPVFIAMKVDKIDIRTDVHPLAAQQ